MPVFRFMIGVARFKVGFLYRCEIVSILGGFLFLCREELQHVEKR